MNATIDHNIFRSVSIEETGEGFVAVLYTYDEHARSTTSYTLTGAYVVRSNLEAILPELVLP